MKNLLFILSVILLLIDGLSAQSPLSDSSDSKGQMIDEMFKTQVTLTAKSFYANPDKEYLFLLNTGDKELDFKLLGGESPSFFFNDSVKVVSRISEKDHSVIFSFPSVLGREVLTLLPAIANFEMIEMKKIKEMKPSIKVYGSDTTCTKGVFPEDSGALIGQNFDLCFCSQYEKDTLQLFNSKEMLTYKNRTVLATGSDEYILDHWFEPDNYGFVKFRLTFPDGEEWKIDLISVEN